MQMLNAKSDYARKGVYYLVLSDTDGREVYLIRHRCNGCFETVYRTLFEEKAWKHFQNIL